MIVHIVLMKFKDSHKDQIEPIRAALVALPRHIAEIRYFEVGVNIVESERAYDLSLYSKFDSLDGLKAYQTNAVHQEVLKLIREATSSVVAVDYQS